MTPSTVSTSADVAAVQYDGTYEDLFFYVNGQIEEACRDRRGRAPAHGAEPQRHRHDDVPDAAARPPFCRWRTQRSASGTASPAWRKQTSRRFSRSHTHTQPAQPSTVAHYLLAVIEQLERDSRRLAAAYETTNRCPLGACAITGTGFPIDRQLTSELLGFDGPTGNTYGSIATVDYVLQNVTAALVALAGVGRVVQDLLAWSSAEFGYLRLGDGFVQGSSIMPQKRNPVGLEHATRHLQQGAGRGHGRRRRRPQHAVR